MDASDRPRTGSTFPALGGPIDGAEVEYDGDTTYSFRIVDYRWDEVGQTARVVFYRLIGITDDDETDRWCWVYDGVRLTEALPIILRAGRANGPA